MTTPVMSVEAVAAPEMSAEATAMATPEMGVKLEGGARDERRDSDGDGGAGDERQGNGQ